MKKHRTGLRWQAIWVARSPTRWRRSLGPAEFSRHACESALLSGIFEVNGRSLEGEAVLEMGRSQGWGSGTASMIQTKARSPTGKRPANIFPSAFSGDPDAPFWHPAGSGTPSRISPPRRMLRADGAVQGDLGEQQVKNIARPVRV
jgi:hypothetical protein